MTHAPHHHGLFMSDVPGRTDKIKIKVANDSYIIPADIVSALGEGNTLAGAKYLDSIFPAPKGGKGFAAGGKVDIIVAGGEYHVSPEAVKKLGNGDLQHGHDILEQFVKHVREKNTKELATLPGPKK